MKQVTARELQVGDTILNVWGVELDRPAIVQTITTISLNGERVPFMVKLGSGKAIPVRMNDSRPITIQVGQA